MISRHGRFLRPRQAGPRTAAPDIAAADRALTSLSVLAGRVLFPDVCTRATRQTLPAGPAAAAARRCNEYTCTYAHTRLLFLPAKYAVVPKPRFPINNLIISKLPDPIHGQTSVYKLELPNSVGN